MNNNLDFKMAFTEQLADPKLKLTARHRRRAMRARSTIYVPVQTPKDPAQKLAEKVMGLSCGKLVRFIQKSARKAATAKHLLVKMHEKSPFRESMQVEQDRQIARMLGARDELNRRFASHQRASSESPHDPFEIPHDTSPHNDNNITGPTA